MKADGEIIIDTEIRSDGMKEGTREVEGAVRRMAGSVNDLGKKAEIALQKQVSAFTKLNNAYAAQERKVEELKAAVEAYGETKIPTQEYVEIQNQIDVAETKLQALQERQDRFLETGGRTKSSTYQRMQYDIDELAKTIEYAKGELTDLEESGKAFTLGKDTEQFSTMTDKYVAASEKLKNMNETLGASYSRIKNEFTEYKKRLLGIDSANIKANKSGKKLNKTLGNANKSSKKTRKSFGQLLKTMLLYRALRSAVSAAISGAKEGMENLAQYSDETNTAISLLLSRMTQLKNSFATAFSPAIEYAAPALAKLISLLAEAVTWTSQLLAALAGKDTFVKAVEVQQDYAASLDKTADSTEDAAKAAEKALAPFDDLIQIQKSGTKTDTTGKEDAELKPSQMFETVEVSNKAKQLAEDIKKTFAGLFDPIKQSWEENGPTTFASVKNLLTAAKQLASDVGASFMQVWNVEGYGKAITDDLVITFSNLVQAAANLVTQFDLAWTSGNVGISIIRHLGDIILEFTGFLRQASDSIKNWAGNLNFSPLLESFDRILTAIRPIVNDIGSALLWLLDNVLLPLAKWGIEQVLPNVFDLIASALKALHEVIVALEPLALWLWEEFLKPLGMWTAEMFILAIKKVIEWLEKFSKWARENPEAIQNMTIVVLGFFAAWKLATFISNISKAISSLTKFTTVLSFIASPAGIAVLAIGSIITAIGLLIYNSDDAKKAIKDAFDKIQEKFENLQEKIEKFSEKISKLYDEHIKPVLDRLGERFKEVLEGPVQEAIDSAMEFLGKFGEFIDFLWKEIIAPFFDYLINIIIPVLGPIIETIGNIVIDVISGIATAISGIFDALTGVIDFIMGVFTGDWERAWDGIQKIFDGVWKAIEATLETIGNVILDIIGGIIDSIKKAVTAVSELTGKSSSSSTSSSYGSYSRSSGYPVSAYSAIPYQPPMLATGTVVPPRAGISYFGIGDNNHEPEVVSPLSTMKQALKEALLEVGMDGERDITVQMVLNDRVFGQAVYKANNQEKQRVGVRMVSQNG